MSEKDPIAGIVRAVSGGDAGPAPDPEGPIRRPALGPAVLALAIFVAALAAVPVWLVATAAPGDLLAGLAAGDPAAVLGLGLPWGGE